MKTTPVLLLIAVCAIGTSIFAQPVSTPAYAWLEGNWHGDGFGGTSQEIWSQPDAEGRMMGVYRHYKADGSLHFYEFLVLDHKGMHVKHFTPALHAWEEREAYHTFKMIKHDPTSIEMEGLVFRRLSSSQLEIYLKTQNDKGEIRLDTIHMTRQ